MTNIRNALMQAAGSASGDKVYVEDVFSTFLYTGTGSSQGIDNNIDLDDKGGLVWIKNRDAADSHILTDTTRGVTKYLSSDSTSAETTDADTLTSFDSDGFTIGADDKVNTNTEDYVSWSFAKQEGFFDVVEYTGNGSNQSIAHNLGVTPGFVVVKSKDQARNWSCWHKSIGNDKYILLNSTGIAADSGATRTVNSTHYQIFGSWNDEGVNGEDYVIYLFADGDESDAQIFGDDGDEQIIKTGSYQSTGNGDEVFVNLGFEPQWVMVKATTHNAGNGWIIQDNMMGLSTSASNNYVLANTSGAENSDGSGVYAKAAPNGMTISVSALQNWFNSVETYIYVAIRRGPMKEPSAGTDVFGTAAATTNAPSFKTGNLVDLGFYKDLAGTAGAYLSSRLTQGSYLTTSTNGAKATLAAAKFDFETGWYDSSTFNDSNYHGYGFRRYPKVFDVAVYTGDGSTGASQPHNLGVIPELKIIKNLAESIFWVVGGSVISGVGGRADNLVLNSDAATASNSTYWEAADTATTFSVRGGNGASSNNGINYVAYLFATLAGISKVGTYTGTGNDLNVTGLGAAARFVMIKRTDNTGDWYVYDSARGIVSGNDPYWFMNGGAEVTNTDYIDAHASGFTVTSSAPAGLNASGGTYLYLAFS